MDAKWKESFTIATECANLYALCVPKALTFTGGGRFGFIYIFLLTHCVVRRAILRCKCRDGLVLANFCIFVPITERGAGSQV